MAMGELCHVRDIPMLINLAFRLCQARTTGGILAASAENSRMRLKDKIALITGAGSEIGEATAKTFAREGATVVVVDLNEDGATRVVSEIRKAGGAAESL